MRVSLSIVLFLALISPVLAQERPRPPAPFSDPLESLRNPAVQRELKLSEEQVKKLQELLQKVVSEALTSEQAKRLKQIQLQQRGPDAFSDPEVAKALKLTEEQTEKIRGIREEGGQQVRELFQAGGGNREEATKKFAALRKEITDKAVGVLKEEQKKLWKDMLGEPFDPRRDRPSQ